MQIQTIVRKKYQRRLIVFSTLPQLYNFMLKKFNLDASFVHQLIACAKILDFHFPNTYKYIFLRNLQQKLH